jgi:hypothetical protein
VPCGVPIRSNALRIWRKIPFGRSHHMSKRNILTLLCILGCAWLCDLPRIGQDSWLFPLNLKVLSRCCRNNANNHSFCEFLTFSALGFQYSPRYQSKLHVMLTSHISTHLANCLDQISLITVEKPFAVGSVEWRRDSCVGDRNRKR